MDMRPTGERSLESFVGRGSRFTSNVPVARVLMGASFAVLFEFVDELCKADGAKSNIRNCEAASISAK